MNWQSTQQKLEAIFQARAFSELPWEALVTLAQRFEAHRYESGQPLGDYVFLLVEGQVQGWPERQLMSNLSPDRPTLAACTVLRLDRQAFAQLLLWFPEIAPQLLGGPI